MEFLAGLGGGKVSFKGDAGTQVLCHEVPGWLCSWYAWKTCVCVLGGKGEHRKGMCGQGSSRGSWQTLLLKPLKIKMGFLALLGGQRVAWTRDAWTRSSWGSWQTLFLTPLGLLSVLGGGKGQHWRGCRDTSPMPWGSWQTLLLKLLKKCGRKSLTQALMRFLTDSVLETFEKHGFARPAGKRAKASTERGCRDTTPMSWSSWLASFLIASKNMGLLAVLGGGRVSYVMRFLTDFVLETSEKHGLAGRQSSAANIVDRSPFGVPGRFCSRNVWKTWVCWLFCGGKGQNHRERKDHNGLINRQNHERDLKWTKLRESL